MAFDIDKIESKIDKVVTGGIELSDEGSGIAIRRLIDAMEIAIIFATSIASIRRLMAMPEPSSSSSMPPVTTLSIFDSILSMSNAIKSIL